MTTQPPNHPATTGYPPIEEILLLIADLQAKMRIQDWDITFKYADAKRLHQENIPQNAFGATNRLPRAMRGEVIINSDSDEGERYWYRTLVHELMHYLTLDLKELAFNMIDLIPKECQDTFRELWDEQYEVMNERVSIAYLNAEGKRDDGTTK